MEGEEEDKGGGGVMITSVPLSTKQRVEEWHVTADFLIELLMSKADGVFATMSYFAIVVVSSLHLLCLGGAGRGRGRGKGRRRGR